MFWSTNKIKPKKTVVANFMLDSGFLFWTQVSE